MFWQLWELAISPQVLPVTVLLGLMMFYWLLNLLGAVDLDFGVDASFDGPEPGDGHGHHEHGGWLTGALRVVNATDVPLMVVLTFLTIFLWGGVMIGHQLWEVGGWMSGLIALGAFVVSLVLTRLILQPLKPFFRALRADDEKVEPVVGRVGVVRTAKVDGHGGQVEVENCEAPLLLTARIGEGERELLRGEKILVIEHDVERAVYVVRALEHSSNPTSTES